MPPEPSEPDSRLGPATAQDRYADVEILIEHEPWGRSIDLGLLQSCADAAASVAQDRRIDRVGAGPGAVALALGDDATVAGLNARFRGKAGATNVLSFPNADPRLGLGDVILAFETVQAEAAAAGVSLTHHACHLAVHGILHLAGYDHENDAAARIMETAESRLLASFGIPDPYREQTAEA